MIGQAVRDTVGVLNWLFLGYFVALQGFQLVLLMSSGLELRKLRLLRRGPTVDLTPPALLPSISVLVPAHNEATMIVDTVAAALAIDYPNLQVVVVNDGSVDTTLDELSAAYQLRPVTRLAPRRLATSPVHCVFRSDLNPGLVVVDKVNGGKSDALNAGIGHSSGRLICVIDADTIIEPGALRRLSQPFLDDPRTIASGGTVRVINGCDVESGRVVKVGRPRNLLPAIQSIEYVRAFLFGRLGLNRLGGNIIISGAFGLFDREEVLSVGGYAQDTVGEDMELVTRLRRRALDQGRPHEITFLAESVAWTEAPESVRHLAAQRRRWYRGLIEVLVRHRSMIGRREYGRLGTVVMPCYVLFELLAPMLEVTGLVLVALGLALAMTSLEMAALIAAASLGLGFTVTVVSHWIDGAGRASHQGRARPLEVIGLAAVEQLVFRPVVTVWKIAGLMSVVRRSRGWGYAQRRGFSPDGSPAPAAMTARN